MALKDDLKKYIEIGLSKGKKAAVQAKDTLKDLGEQGVLQVEIKQLEHDVKEIMLKIGESVYQKAQVEDQTSIDIDGSELKVLVSQIKDLKEQIASREDKILEVRARDNAGK